MAKGYSRDEVRVGAFVLVAFTAFFVFLLKVKALPEWFAETVKAETVLDSLGGISYPSPLKYAGGLEIGKVVGAAPEGEKVRVFMEIDRAFAEKTLPRHVRAVVASASLLGDPALEIRPVPAGEVERAQAAGAAEALAYVVRDDGVFEIPAQSTTSLAELQNQVAKVLRQVERFTSRLDTVGDTVERIVEGARRIVDDDRFRADIHGTVAAWRSAGVRVDQTVERVGAQADATLVPWREAGVVAAGAIAEVGDSAVLLVQDWRQAGVNWGAAGGRVDRLLEERGEPIMRNFETFSERIANNPSSLVWGSGRPGRGAGASSPTGYR